MTSIHYFSWGKIYSMEICNLLLSDMSDSLAAFIVRIKKVYIPQNVLIWKKSDCSVLWWYCRDEPEKTVARYMQIKFFLSKENCDHNELIRLHLTLSVYLHYRCVSFQAHYIAWDDCKIIWFCMPHSLQNKIIGQNKILNELK